jgi:hypothetical protein
MLNDFVGDNNGGAISNAPGGTVLGLRAALGQ